MRFFVFTDCANIDLSITKRAQHVEKFNTVNDLKVKLISRFFDSDDTTDDWVNTYLNTEEEAEFIRKHEDAIKQEKEHYFNHLMKHSEENKLIRTKFMGNHDCCTYYLYITEDTKFKLTQEDIEVFKQ